MWRKIAAVIGGIVLAGSATAQAQTAIPDGYQIVHVEYSGHVTSSITDQIVVRDADGNGMYYTGPVPDFPFDTGDRITIGFDAIVPTAESIEAGVVPPSADGIYAFRIGPRPSQLTDYPGTASFVNFTGNGGIADVGQYGTDSNLFILYNANTGGYEIAPGFDSTGAYQVAPAYDNDGNFRFGIGSIDFPLLAYDSATGELRLSSFMETFGTPNTLSWNGSVESPYSGLFPTGIFNFDSGVPVGSGGYFSTSAFLFPELSLDRGISVTGDWNLPVYSPATQVPEPPFIAIFAAVLALLVMRRRRAMA